MPTIYPYGVAIERAIKVPLGMVADPSIPLERLVAYAKQGPPPTSDNPLPGMRGEFVAEVIRILREGDHHMLGAWNARGDGPVKCILIEDDGVVYRGTEKRFTGRRKWPKDD